METNLIVEEIILDLLNTIALGTPAPPTFIIEPDSCSGEKKIIFDINLIQVCVHLLVCTSIN